MQAMVAKLRDMVNRLQTDLDDRAQATAKASAEQANLQVRPVGPRPQRAVLSAAVPPRIGVALDRPRCDKRAPQSQTMRAPTRRR